MIKVILFDFDGTIADSYDSFLEIVNILSDKYHLTKIPPSELNALRLEDAKTLIKKLRIPFFKIPFLARDMKRMQREKMNEIKPFKNLSEVLLRLKDEKYELGILSSNEKENVSEFLKLNNINVFKYIYGNASIFGKDRAINRFLKKNNFTNEEIIYIGDEIRDIQACKRIGVKIISVSWGFNSKDGLIRNNPEYLVDSPEELFNQIRKLN